MCVRHTSLILVFRYKWRGFGRSNPLDDIHLRTCAPPVTSPAPDRPQGVERVGWKTNAHSLLDLGDLASDAEE